MVLELVEKSEVEGSGKTVERGRSLEQGVEIFLGRVEFSIVFWWSSRYRLKIERGCKTNDDILRTQPGIYSGFKIRQLTFGLAIISTRSWPSDCYLAVTSQTRWRRVRDRVSEGTWCNYWAMWSRHGMWTWSVIWAAAGLGLTLGAEYQAMRSEYHRFPVAELRD